MRIDLGGGGASVGHILAGLDSEVLGGDASANTGVFEGVGVFSLSGCSVARLYSKDKE